MPPEPQAPSAARPELAHLLADTLALLQSLDDPQAEAFLAHWPKGDGVCRDLPPATLPVLRWLPNGEATGGLRPRVVSRLHRLQTQLHWQQSYRAEDFGPDFLDRYGWTELIGTRGPVASKVLACGFLLLGPEIDYPDHHHRAEEFYLVLSGTALWRRADLPWCEQPPGSAIYHAPDMRHAMRTSQEPLLALYLWQGGDLGQKPIIR